MGGWTGVLLCALHLFSACHMHFFFFLCFISITLVVSYRSQSEEKRPLSPSLGPYQAEDKITQQTVICHSNPASLSSTESSEGGKPLYFVCPMEIINCAL